MTHNSSSSSPDSLSSKANAVISCVMSFASDWPSIWIRKVV